MPAQLDETDEAIIKALKEDGRKSFRQIARETGVSTPTVKARFNRLINIGFLKSVSPIFDSSKIEKNYQLNSSTKTDSNNLHYNSELKIGKNTKIKLICDFCEGPISGEAHVFRFAEYERFFCCIQCRAAYKEKYRGRIESLTKRYEA
jgi:Lrp/AsnC family leucine-responsive transcriptional regulator